MENERFLPPHPATTLRLTPSSLSNSTPYFFLFFSSFPDKRVEIMAPANLSNTCSVFERWWKTASISIYIYYTKRSLVERRNLVDARTSVAKDLAQISRQDNAAMWSSPNPDSPEIPSSLFPFEERQNAVQIHSP